MWRTIVLTVRKNTKYKFVNSGRGLRIEHTDKEERLDSFLQFPEGTELRMARRRGLEPLQRLKTQVNRLAITL